MQSDTLSKVKFHSLCYTLTATLCEDGEIRLIAGNISSTEGHVEICSGNVWGTVCADGWDTPDAQVACRQLGFSSSGT